MASRSEAPASAPASPPPPTRPTAVAAPAPEPIERSAADILAGRIRLMLAGRFYTLRVLTIGENEDWMASLDAQLVPLVADKATVSEAVEYLDQFNELLLPFLWAYDKDGVLPTLENIRRDIYPHEALKAVMEVRLAANPTLGLKLIGTLQETRNQTASAPTSLRQRLMAGLSRTFVN